jgi:pimeloyl-ACP methyl ester carboxylesterase
MSPSRLWAAVLGVVVLATARGGLCSPASAPPSILSQQVTEPVFGSRVYVAEAGRSHPFTVVLVHGLGEDGSRVWDSLVPVLAEKYHVVTFDLPGFGRSSKPDAVYSPSAYADFVKWAVDRFVPGRFALAGHSLGGAVAIRYAAKYPDRLDRLVLADVAGVLHRVALTREMLSTDLASRAPSGAEGPLRALDKLVRSTLTRIPSLSLDIGTVYEAPYLREKVLGSDPGRVAALALSEDDLTEAVYGIQVPTLVLWGTKDRVASLRTASALAQSSASKAKLFVTLS